MLLTYDAKVQLLSQAELSQTHADNVDPPPSPPPHPLNARARATSKIFFRHMFPPLVENELLNKDDAKGTRRTACAYLAILIYRRPAPGKWFLLLKQ